MPNHIFISYAREDQPYTRKLAHHLRQRGFDVWIDDRIDFGDRWWQTIVQALRTSAAFIAVMAPESEKSEWVEREVLLALKERKPIFPLLLRGDGFPILINTQYSDVTGGRMPPEDFCDRLREVLSAQKVSQPAPQKPAILPRKHPFEPDMILIPTGDFLMGSDPAKDKDAEDEEQPQHTLLLPDYYIAKTPITNTQYAAFVHAIGHRSPKHWKNNEPPHGKQDHPVVNVSWYDAVAYCTWLAALTRRSYRLPSEAEWEKAARGPDGRIYPWGGDGDPQRCNSAKAGPGDTTPVGAYPAGASSYGLLDMAGNVWEWTRSMWGTDLHRPDFTYPYDPEDGREDLEAGRHVRRVLRGGAFDNLARDLRSAYRVRNVPHERGNFIGFRAVASPITSDHSAL